MCTDHAESAPTEAVAFEELLSELAQETAEHGAAPRERVFDDEADLLESPGGFPERSTTPISKDAIDLLIAAEVSSEAAYRAKFSHPIWPGGQSGVTIGIGYDVGTVSPAVLAQDWSEELSRELIQRLAASCGVLGPAAAHAIPKLRDITVPFETANRVFAARSVPQFVARTERALKNTRLLHPHCLGALVSLAYNRGPAFSKDGDRFREMRAIRDHMIDRRFDLIPGEFRSMKRLWAGNPKLRGLLLRREAEAKLFERGLAAGSARPESAALEAIPAGAPAAPEAAGLEGLFSTIGGWLRSVVQEPTRDHVMFALSRPDRDDGPIERDEHYVAVRVLAARIVNARRWTSLYHGAVHATCSMLYEGLGQDRIERQAVLAPDGFRDIDPKGPGKLLQVDRPLFGPMPYRGDLRLSIALFSVKSSDLAGPYLSLISDLSQTVSSGFLSAAQPFVAPVKKASDLLFGTSDAASLECGTVRGFEPLKAGIWVSIGARRDEIGSTDGFSLDPEDFRLLDADGQPFEDYPYLVFEIQRLRERDNWMEIPNLKTAWDALTTALAAGKLDEAKAAEQAFRRLCLAGGDLTERDATRLAAKAERKLALLADGTTEAPPLESLRSLDLYDDAPEAPVPLDEDAHTDPEAPLPEAPEPGLEAVRPWRVAEALLVLRRQVNARAPHRSKASDGTIGDAAHAVRTSDHNPWIVDAGTGVVTGMDLTHDPAGGCDAGALAEALRAGRDPRIKYVIWNRQIFSATVNPWTWRSYTGRNPHNKHVHISVREDKDHYDQASEWSL
ncbi:hypothetical protein [Methylobacterium nodulans]|uniref:Uncharacterized protein n=1 Tax=Methylobacterium nodulans (strain LMG 21967 / CNCM I-2342 / ORS 2060) TaxID=460265 RepID=B8ICT7_METNO|nr:hypothetical protein [Methylobacterium nodulans]ACL57498.1 hypothetical protein Mnod_2529 [Methylobacterium nodulans ORS 2060]